MHREKPPFQSATEQVFVIPELAIRRWFDLRAQNLKWDPQTDDVISAYANGQLDQARNNITQSIINLGKNSSDFVHRPWEAE